MRRQKKKRRGKKKKDFSFFWLFLLLLVSGILIAYYFYAQPKPVIHRSEINLPRGYQSFGIDISHHQEDIDWETLLNESDYDSLLHFVYFKVSEGSSHEDQKWMQHQKTLKNKGIHHGAYHFFLPKIDAKEQANHFLSKWTKTKSDLPPVIDVEIEDKNLIQGTLLWLKEVENRTGVRPIIYTSTHLFERYFKSSFKEYNFWVAGYSKEPESTKDPRVLIWQYSDKGRLPGIKTTVDLNYCKIRFD